MKRTTDIEELKKGGAFTCRHEGPNHRADMYFMRMLVEVK
jgi:hypothetical protein